MARCDLPGSSARVERAFAAVFRLEMEQLREQVDRMLRPPWWARAVGWGIAVFYALRR